LRARDQIVKNGVQEGTAVYSDLVESKAEILRIQREPSVNAKEREIQKRALYFFPKKLLKCAFIAAFVK
jgi:hypothetical protein